MALLVAHTYGFFPSFFYLTERTAIAPRWFTLLLFAASGLFLAAGFRLRDMTRYLQRRRMAVIWLMYASLLVFAYYVPGKTGLLYFAEATANQYISGLMILVAALFLMANSETRLRLPTMMRILLLFASVLIIHDFFFPGWLVPMESEYSNFGRGAGHYVNANTAAQAIVYGLLFLFAAEKSERRRYPCFAIGIFALIVTFSRSAWIAFFFCMVAGVFLHVIPRRFFWGIVAITALDVLLYILLTQYTPLARAPGVEFLHDSLQNPVVRWHSVSERMALMRAAFDMIRESPLLGNGIGAAKSPHNVYLELWANHGLFGLLLVFSLLAAIFSRFFDKREENEIRCFSFLAGCALFIFCFFQHWLLGMGPQLLAIAVALFGDRHVLARAGNQRQPFSGMPA
ncbi:MAG: O-antigen ligase family protein [Zoogloeaceae bacterium]|nr:O-antigen ligase family protein [Zoogloeaceae bacterium]